VVVNSKALISNDLSSKRPIRQRKNHSFTDCDFFVAGDSAPELNFSGDFGRFRSFRCRDSGHAKWDKWDTKMPSSQKE